MRQKRGKNMKKANFEQLIRGEAPVCSSKYTKVVGKTCVKDKTEGQKKSRNAKKFSWISFFFQ